MVHVHCRIFGRFPLIKANTDAGGIIHICIAVPDIRTAREYGLLLLGKAGKFLDTEVVAVQVQMHLGAHPDGRQVIGTMPCGPHPVCIAEVCQLHGRGHASDIA